MEPAVYVLFNAYGYNARSELVLAAKNAEDAKEHEYGYDDIGNRTSSSDLGTTRAYTANSLNQYTEISTLRASAPPRETFIPQFDDDGNQTLIRTRTGTWSVAYNGENRPNLWECGSTNITMSFNRMGRRVSYTETEGVTTNAHCTFTYDNYLCIQQIEDSATIHYSQSPIHCFVWDPTEPIATRPLVWQYNGGTYFYTHDGNKNVSEVVDDDGSVVAHYEYAPFGDVTVAAGDLAFDNPFRFSSEYADDALGLAYYNYRHYDPVAGRWIRRDPFDQYILNLFCYVNNQSVRFVDRLGLSSLWDWIRDVWNKPKCEKSGGLYANGKCCCNQQYFDPNSYCCLNGITHKKEGEVAATVYMVYLSSGLRNGWGNLPAHYWLEWDDKRVESNEDNDDRGLVKYAWPTTPHYLDYRYNTFYPRKHREIKIRVCEGGDVKKFKECLTRYAENDNGALTGKKCYVYVDDLINTCLAEQTEVRGAAK